MHEDITIFQTKKHKESNTLGCGDYNEYVLENFSSTSMKFYANCQIKNESFSITNSRFINCHMTNWGDCFFIFLQNSNAEIKNSTFDFCKYQNNLIGLSESDSNYYVHFYSNRISHCSHFNNQTSMVFNSYYHQNDIQNNTVKYDKINYPNRVFNFIYYGKCKFIGNSILNANYEEASAVMLHIQEQYNEFIMSDCIFTNCRGNVGASVFIKDCTMNLTFKNLTFQDTTNNYIQNNGQNRGYIFRIDRINLGTEVLHTTVDLINCSFKNLITNGQNCGGYGMTAKKKYGDNANLYSYELTIKNTIFENIYFTHDKYGGGAISLSHEINENRHTQLSLCDCIFNNISCKNGGGGAIYFNTPSQKLTIERTKFKNIGADNVDFGGCIYVKYESDPMPIIIKYCSFENTTSKEGGAIYIDWNLNSQSLISIEGCTFYKTSSKSNGHSIVVSNSKSNEVLISNCKFIDCGFNFSSSVVIDACMLNFTYNSIDFSECKQSCGCLELRQIQRHAIFGNTFRNSKSVNNSFVTGINFVSIQDNFSLTIVNNTFDNIGGTCICLQASSQNGLTFRNNTIKNIEEGENLIKFVFHCESDLFVVESCNFINNKYDKLTPQVWIEFSSGSKSDRFKYELLFDDCLFENCSSLTKGGALYHEENNIIMNTKLSFNECKFIGNSAKKNGAALWIHAHQGCEIYSCTFIRNHCDEGCGAIHIETNFQYSFEKNYTINIVGSEFEENGGKNANCVYITNSPKENILISECSFKDCGKDGYIISLQSTDISIIIENCSFSFTKDLNSLKTIGINSCTDNIILIGNSFHKFQNVIIHATCLLNGHNQFELIDNNITESSEHSPFYFENILTKSPIIKGNTFNKIRISEEFLSLKMNDNIETFIFDNNTFSNFRTNYYFGGIGVDINHRNKEIPFNLQFNDCFFYDVRRMGSTNQGVITCDFNMNNGNVYLSVTKCNFINNAGMNFGASIYVNIQHDIDIKECIFESNNEKGHSNIYINSDYGNVKTESSISIIDCHFYKNNNPIFSSIEIHSGSTKSVNIQKCSFENEIGGITILRIENNINIEQNHFYKCNKNTALRINCNSENHELTINKCTFESCNGTDPKCFKIILNWLNFKFENNVIKNNRGTGCSDYIGSIECMDQMNSLEIVNNSFVNNVCESLYGGGIGIKISGIEYLSFIGCTFDNNTAKQNKETSRPIQRSKSPYYNGDGGCIQIGYVCMFNNFFISFDKCYFKNNKAERHGGAIAIQTIWDVNITNCVFENNVANYGKSSSKNLKGSSYYDQKREGRGGAIYINPTNSYDEETSSFKAPINGSTDILIEECRFIKNSGFDGYAFYIEGDDSIQNVDVEIHENRFIDNYNENNYINGNKNKINGSVIATEIFNIQEKQLINDNNFRYTNKKIEVDELSYVDHYGKAINSIDEGKSYKSKEIVIIVSIAVAVTIVVTVLIVVSFIFILKKRKERNTLGDNLLDIEHGSQESGSIYGLASYE
ncbi:hypothetical protein M9Y10_029921 [Tritrichomonas musculus]|uniref:Right handed beta helix domain-containing protein n=1 Tax=Tritrichomonas musculus TaxID=1915356 RepID=A0ABR2KPC6_9EUKA